MNKSHQPAAPSARKSRTAKNIAALAGGTATAAALTGASEAAVVHLTTPLDVQTTGGTTTVPWDVDSANGADFHLENIVPGSTIYLQLNSDGNNGEGMVKLAAAGGNVLRNLPNGISVGPTLTAAYAWGGSGEAGRTAIYQLTSSANSEGIDLNFSGFSNGVAGNIGFRFGSGGNTHYGWASVTLLLNNSSVTINEWAYESSPDTAIVVGQVPEPSVASLGLLAAGAAGLRRRRRKQ